MDREAKVIRLARATKPYAPPLPTAFLGERARLYPLTGVDGGVRVKGRLGTLRALHGEIALVSIHGEKEIVTDSVTRANPRGTPVMRRVRVTEVEQS